MAFLSATLERFGASPTVAMTTRAAALRAGGADIVALAAGEPDFDTPAHIRAAAVAAMERGETRYTAVDGTAELKAAVAEKFVRDNGLTYAPDEITVGSGGKHVIWNALLATLEPGDEAIVPAPYWVSYPDMVRFCGAEPVIVPAGPEAGFRLSAEAHFLLRNPACPRGGPRSLQRVDMRRRKRRSECLSGALDSGRVRARAGVHRQSSDALQDEHKGLRDGDPLAPRERGTVQ